MARDGCTMQKGSPSVGFGIFQRNNLRVHICTFGDKEFNCFQLTTRSSSIQRGVSCNSRTSSLGIHIQTFIDEEFDDFPVAYTRSIMQQR